ncbi:PQQ-binding-like beta-propeller repeat protein [Geomicrobium sp. JCM 19037]|uniref:outer membrane protein assembly factor BamB family protein n=1 Tax=Geomicrobium sp. JCM 19037 TaxID=1460634 RepID=UPI001EE68FB4|nr:PQQ-binding-like beta-propeller repeat protein [Geomicrobium sp. JCM 19037]
MSGQGIVNTTYEVDVAATDEVTITVQRSETSEQPYWQTRNQNVERNAVADAHVDPSFLDLAWESSAPGRTIFSSPVANEDTIVYTTDAGYVHAVDRDREETRWSYRTQSLNRSTPTIAGDYVYVTGGQNQRLYRIHLDTGVVDWEIVLDNVPIYESPLYHDGVLYLTSNISGNTTVVAIQAEDGSELWRAEVQGDTYFGAAIAEEQLVVGSYSGRAIYALSLEDGSENWHVQTGSQEGFAATLQ